MMNRPLKRREFLAALGGLGSVGLGTSISACSTTPSNKRQPLKPGQYGRLKKPGLRPFPDQPAGKDMLEEIDHIVVVMLENHSFDNLLGMLGRGDGFSLSPSGLPLETNPTSSGQEMSLFHMSTPCQLSGYPQNSWNASHISFDNGSNQGFVKSASGPVAMGYWTPKDMPFTAGLARTFPIGDRYFCSVLGPTYPNRCFFMAGTASGLTSDTIQLTMPANGTIFTMLDRFGISWKNYYSSAPSLGIILPQLTNTTMRKNAVSIEQFYSDATEGTLPGFSMVDPNFGANSEEDPQDIQEGDVFLASVVNAVMGGKRWSKTMLVWTYDEHGGYYDHVPPPSVVEPDDILPKISVPPDQPGNFKRYGFRVPFGVVSPYARPNYVSHVTHDHTSILKLIETKWNLPSLTYRDANADSLLDSLDLRAKPAFLEAPSLPLPANPSLRSSCLTQGSIPVPSPG